MEWLAKSIGFVDMVCCYSYSEQQIYSEETPFQADSRSNFLTQSPSWNVDGNSILEHHQESKYLSNHGKIGHSAHEERYPHKGRGGKENSPGRSVSTRSTVTTATTTTVVTSCRTRAGSTDNSIASLSSDRRVPQHIHSRRSQNDAAGDGRTRRKPEQIYCHSHSDGEIYEPHKLMPVNSRSFPDVSFNSATEGYPVLK
jgi:hypothetical protein